MQLISLFYSIFFICICSQPQCVPVTTSTCPDVFSELYYISVTGREESETFSTVMEISDQLDIFCKNALAVYACYFIHPPCDPDRGTSLTIALWMHNKLAVCYITVSNNTISSFIKHLCSFYIVDI